MTETTQVNMTNSELKELLTSLAACGDARKWLGRRDAETAWNECQEPEWMFWIAGRRDVSRQKLVLAACACAGLALPYVEKGEDRPRIAIETAERWARGEATIEEVREARKNASAAAHAAYAAYAAAHAAYAYAADAAYAYAAAAHAAYAAAVAAAAAAADAAARKKIKSACADEIRKFITLEDLMA